MIVTVKRTESGQDVPDVFCQPQSYPQVIPGDPEELPLVKGKAVRFSYKLGTFEHRCSCPDTSNRMLVRGEERPLLNPFQ